VPHLLKGFLIVAILSAAMSSVSSALTSLASVSTMDFVKPVLTGRSEAFFLRFSKASTVLWAAALIFTAYLSRNVPFVLNAAFALRGLTSGALVGGLALAVFWKQGRGIPVITGMLVSLVTMTSLQLLPKLACTQALWMKLVGTEVFWPWYTLIGATITLLTAWLVRKLLPRPAPVAQASKPAVSPTSKSAGPAQS
jgi:Na+/proline symporter